MSKFMETVQRYPIGSCVQLPGEGRETLHEVQGYEFYNGGGYLLCTDNTRVSMEQLEADRNF